MFPGQGLQQPLHFGLEFHNGLTFAGILLWNGQEVEKDKGMWGLPDREVGSSLPRARTRESWGNVWPRTSEGAEIHRILETGPPGVMEGDP